MSRICGIFICTKPFSLIGFFSLTRHYNPATSLMPKMVLTYCCTGNIFIQSCKLPCQKCPLGSVREELPGCETAIFLDQLIHKFCLVLVIMELKCLLQQSLCHSRRVQRWTSGGDFITADLYCEAFPQKIHQSYIITCTMLSVFPGKNTSIFLSERNLKYITV